MHCYTIPYGSCSAGLAIHKRSGHCARSTAGPFMIAALILEHRTRHNPLVRDPTASERPVSLPQKPVPAASIRA